MQLSITADDLIGNIQSGFHQQYPFLRLSFYRNPHDPGRASPRQERLPASMPIDDIRMFHREGPINISPDRVVAELEHEFFIRFGLCVQVEHRSGGQWLETTVTDSATLAELSEKAAMSCVPLPPSGADEYGLADVG